MYDDIRFIGDLFVMVLIAFPPFLYLYNYLMDKVERLWIRLILYILYWGGTALFSNIFPAAAVLFLIFQSRKLRKEQINSDEIMINKRKSFNLDSCDNKWKFSFKTFIIYSFIGFFIKLIVTYINIIVVFILEKYDIILEEQEVISEFLKSGPLKSIMFFIIIVFGAPIVEEFVFRFWIYDRILKPRINAILAAIFSNLLFMAAHFNAQGAISFFLIGVINCILYDKKGYWAAVANHFIFNFISVILLIIIKLFNIPIEV